MLESLEVLKEKLKMKKKILCLILILMLAGTMLVLTGCGASDESENVIQEGTDKNMENKVSDDNATEDKLVISSLEQNFSENQDEAVVKLKNDSNYYNYYVINIEGKILYNFTTTSYWEGTYINGYVYSSVENWVKDAKTDEIIVQGDEEKEKTEILGITETGYILQRVKKEELSGNTYIFQTVDKDGNETWSSESASSEAYFAVLTKDCVVYHNDYGNNNYILIDAKTGETFDLGFSCITKYFDYSVVDGYICLGCSTTGNSYLMFDISNDKLINTGVTLVQKFLNSEYAYARDNGEEEGIYTMDGNTTLVKSLEDGGVESIYYYNNKYYVISTTGYYYTMDDSFEYVTEPVKIDTEIYNNSLISVMPTKYGIIVGNTTGYYLVDESDFKANEDVTDKGVSLSNISFYESTSGWNYLNKYMFLNESR